MDAAAPGYALITMNPAKKAVQTVDRFQRRFPWLAFPVAVWKKFGDDQAGNLAALVAYYAFVSIFPLLLVLFTVLEIVLRHHSALAKELEDGAVKNYGALGSSLTQSIHSFNGTGPALVIGVLLSFLGARGVANAMQNALNSVWEVPKADRPGFPWSWLRSFGLILVVGLGEIATSVLSSFIISRGHLLPGFAITVLATIVTLLFNIGLFWLAFRLAAAKTITWRDLRLGAIMGGIVWQILQLVGGYYIGHQLRHSTSLYGSTFAIVLGLIAWLYLQAEATLYVAEANVVWVRKLWPRSLAPPPHTEEDVRAYELYAEAEARNKGRDHQRGRSWPSRRGESASELTRCRADRSRADRSRAGPKPRGPKPRGPKPRGPKPRRTEPEKSTVSAKRARGEDPHDSGDDR